MEDGADAPQAVTPFAFRQPKKASQTPLLPSNSDEEHESIRIYHQSEGSYQQASSLQAVQEESDSDLPLGSSVTPQRQPSPLGLPQACPAEGREGSAENQPLLRGPSHAPEVRKGGYLSFGEPILTRDSEPVLIEGPRESRIESSTYATPDNAVYEAAQIGKGIWADRWRAFSRWLFNFAVAVFVALVAVFITYATRKLTSWRFYILNSLIDLEKDGTSGFGTALSGFTAVSIVYALVAALATAYIAPVAAGSGISEIKCILNGIMLPRVLRIKTLVVKVFGLLFSVSSGLPVGREGPMIHTGAIAASGLTQGKSTSMKFDTRCGIYKEFRNDKEKRDFVACGAAAGVAAAFGAPIGGVLFAIEEGVTHWHRQLVWRTFFTAVVTTWINQVLLSGLDDHWGTMGSSGMFSFGTFTTDAEVTWKAWELPFFIGLGAIGGCIGACFIWAQTYLTKFRLRFIPATKPHLRVLEVVAIVALKITVEFVLGILFAACAARPAPNTSSESSYANDLQSFYCDSESYNEMASLFMVPSEDAIRQLFHFASPFSQGGLAVFFACYLGLMCVTYGISVPSGVFIPALLSGSALGRLVGEFLKAQLPGTVSVNAGIYSLVGAAAVLGGVTRMTVSLAVIILETTGNYEFALPITSALLVARFVGNWFNSGIYDLHIELRKWPLLPDTIPTHLTRHLRVCDIMAKPPIVLREIEEVGVLLDVLIRTAHNGFPVVYGVDVMKSHPRIGSLAGLITRRELSVLLHRRAFHQNLPTMPFGAVLTDPTPSAMAAFTISTAGVHLQANQAARDTGVQEPGWLSHPHQYLMDESSGRTSPSLGAPDVAAPLQSLRRPSVRRARQEADVSALPRSPLGWFLKKDAERQVRIRLPAAQGAVKDDLMAAAHAVTSYQGVDNTAENTAKNAMPSRQSNKVGSYSITVADPTSAESIKFFAEEDSFELLYTDEPLLRNEDFEASYPRFPDVTRMRFTEHDKKMYVDLRPYLNPTPHAVHVQAPITRGFELFISLGLRHLPVVNDSHDIVGMLTRHDFSIDHLTHCLAKRRTRAAGRASVQLDPETLDEIISDDEDDHEA